MALVDPADNIQIVKLAAGASSSAVIGTVAIDQTTPGTTNAFSTLGTGINVAATSSDEGAEASTDEAVAPAAAGTRLMGFSCQETAGAAATFSLHNGTSASDPATYVVSLAANESRGEWFGPDGIVSAGGIWLERLTGTTRFIGFYKVVI